LASSCQRRIMRQMWGADPPAQARVTVRLPSILVARIDAAAREQGMGRSEFVRRALAQQVAEVLGDAETPSLYDVLLADGVIGRFAGPPGLSTMPRAALRTRMRDRTLRARGEGGQGDG
jgi:hypothetical protein